MRKSEPAPVTLAGKPEVGDDLGDPATGEIAQLVETGHGLAVEELHRRHAGGHDQRVGREGARVGEEDLVDQRVEHVHHVGPAGEGAHGQAPADHLPEGREVGRVVEPRLRAPVLAAEGDDLV